MKILGGGGGGIALDVFNFLVFITGVIVVSGERKIVGIKSGGT